MADIVFMFDLRHCLPRYLVCIFRSFRTYSCSIACFTLRVRFRIGADLNTTSIMILECFHLVSLLSTLRRLMQENIFLQQKAEVSPISRVSAVSSGCSPIMHEG